MIAVLCALALGLVVGFVAGILFTCLATTSAERRDMLNEAKRKAERRGTP